MNNLNEFKFKKKFGQNFIIDENILKNIVGKSNIEEDSLVIEIGCGAGALTKHLIEKAKYVVGYEIDNSLNPILSRIKSDNFEIIYDDFLKRDVSKDIDKYSYKNLYVISNLPYYITTPIINKIIEAKLNVKKIVIMVQKEVGDRINAKPNTKEYNSLSIFIHYYFDVRKLFDVSKNVFVPRPNVDSIVIELNEKENKYNVLDENLFFKLVKDSFKQKRKTLKNNLKNYNFDIINEVLKRHNFIDTIRAEQIDIETFIEISNELKLSK